MNTENIQPEASAEVPSRISQLQSWYTYYARLLGLQGRGGLLIAVVIALLWINSGIYKV
jgi:hypothetical protein